MIDNELFDNPVPILKIVAGDYVKSNGELYVIKSIYGIKECGQLSKPSEGGFGVITECGKTITMWEAQSYHKAEDVLKNIVS